MKFLALSLAALLPLLSAQEAPNILLICVDDLRPELGCYGVEYIQSPQIDSLAKRGVLFKNHFVQAPTCGASRYALLTGCYGPSGNQALFERANKMANEKPGTELRTEPGTELRTEQRTKPSLPAYFRAKGYTTVAVGKVSHHPGGLGGEDWNDPELLEMPLSWDRQRLPAGPWRHPRGWMHGLANGEIREKGVPMDLLQAQPGEDSIYPDGVTVPVAIEELKGLAEAEAPFFLAVGILRPHLPFGAPQKYHELYQEVDLPAIPHPEKPAEKSTWHRSGEFMGYHRGGKDPNLDADFATEVRRSYAACVSYADTMVGKVLTALAESGEADNTIVVLWGDHGWHLGERAVWGKHTLFEESLRSPLIVSFPRKAKVGRASEEIVQSVDLYPTLCSLAGLDFPAGLDGQSLLPLLDNPERAESRGYAVAYHRGKATIRTATHRLIAHDDGYTELYDRLSPAGESKNIAAQNPVLCEELLSQLKEERAR